VISFYIPEHKKQTSKVECQWYVCWSERNERHTLVDGGLDPAFPLADMLHLSDLPRRVVRDPKLLELSLHMKVVHRPEKKKKKKIEMKKQRNFQQPATKTPSPLSTTPHRPERLRNRSGVIRHMQVKDVNRVHFQCLQRLPELRLNPGRCQPSRS